MADESRRPGVARLTWIAILLFVAVQANADKEPLSKTVIGPSNLYLKEGADALLMGDSDEGVRLTALGLKRAAGRREKKMGHANLCAGFLLLDQPDTALEHCNWVLQRYPSHWRTYNNRALVYLRLRRLEESQADILKGQELNPRSRKLKEVQGLYFEAVDSGDEE